MGALARGPPRRLVLGTETGFDRDYGRNPYPGYDAEGSRPFLFDGEVDGRLEPKARVVALGQDTDPVALPLAVAGGRRVIPLDVAGEPVVVLAVPGLASALDRVGVAANREVAATGAFRPTAGGQRLTFAPDGDARFRDDQTGSTWTVEGRAVAGPLAGERLAPVEHLDTFWFAWAAFQPGTRIAG